MVRRILYVIAALVVVVALGVAVVLMRFDPNAYKPQIEAAVQRATGRTLTLNGRIALQLSLRPTLRVDDAAFANPPGFSRPQMATLHALDVQVALLPLLHGELLIDRLILRQPDILLEIGRDGRPNWQMSQAAPPGGATTGGPSPHGTAPAGNAPTVTSPNGATSGGGATGQDGWSIRSVSVAAVTIEDGRLGWRDDRTGASRSVAVRRLDAAAASPAAPMHLTATGRYEDVPFDIAADTGPLAGLMDGAKTWPVTLRVKAATAQMTAQGTLDTVAPGFDGTVKGSVPDVSALTALLPQARLAPLQDVSFAAHVAGRTGGALALSGVTLHAGSGDLNGVAPGLMLTSLDLSAPAMDQPMRVKATGSRGKVAMTLAGTLGAPGGLLRDGRIGALPVDLTLTAGAATVTAKGGIAHADTLSGVDLAVTAQVPDLQALSPVAGTPLPAVRQIALKGTLSDLAGGLAKGMQVKGLTLTTADGDAAGDLAVALAPRTSVTARLRSQRIDADALQAAFGGAAPAGSRGASSPASPSAPSTPPAAPPAAPSGGGGKVIGGGADGRIFPDTPLPFAMLKAADADIGLDVATLHAGGKDIRAVSVHLALRGGRLAVDRFTADLPAGRMTGTLSADAAQAAPPVRLQLRAPGLALGEVLGWFGEPNAATGNLEVYADLAGAGASPHAIAASLDGTLGLAVPSGTIDARLLSKALGPVLGAVNALDSVNRGGTATLRCFAAKAVARHGDVTIQPMQLSSSMLTMSGSGAANLRDETVSMELRPQMRVAGNTMEVPVRVAGPMRRPGVGVENNVLAQAGIGAVAGALSGQKPADILSGLLGGGKTQSGAAPVDPCPAALAAARGQAAPPAAAPAPATSTAPSSGQPTAKPLLPNLPDPGAALKSLFR